MFGVQDMMYRFSEKLLAACDSVFYALISFNTTLMIVTCLMNGWKRKLLCCVRKKSDFPIKILCQRQWRRDLIKTSRKSCNLVFFYTVNMCPCVSIYKPYLINGMGTLDSAVCLFFRWSLSKRITQSDP